MNRAHLIELNPTERQKALLRRACGVARYTFNWALAECERVYKETGKGQNIPDLKKRWNKEKPAWVYESPKDANQQAFANLSTAYSRFFKKLGRRPTFKKKGKRDSFYVANDKLKVKDSYARLPLIGQIRRKEAPRFEGRVLSGVVSTRAGHWFLAVNYELPDAERAAPDIVLGVDLGVKDLAVLSDGTRFENPKHLRKAKRKLRLAQRRVSRRVKGSQNRIKAKRKLARVHLRVANQRKDTIHKITTHIARSARTIVIEDLNVAGMVKNHNLARAISDCGFHELLRQLKYKAHKVLVADRFYPSSKLCHKCQTKNTQLKLSDRYWTCTCGAVLDRDLNAALNLKAFAGATGKNTPVEIGVPGRAYRLNRSRSSKQEPNRGHVVPQLG
jgi:putative transposase